MTEKRTTDSGNEVAANSGWPIDRQRDYTAGDVRDTDTAVDVHGEPARLVQLPTEPADDRDPGVPPACSFCNADQHLREREGEALKEAVEGGERVEVRYGRNGRPHYGVVVGLQTGARTYTAPQADVPPTLFGLNEGWELAVSPFTDAGYHTVRSNDAEITDAPFPDDVGTIRADYALVGEESGEVLAYGCHACVQE